MTRVLHLTTDGAADGEGSDTLDLDEAAVSQVMRPTTIALLRTIVAENPESIRATAEAVDRDVKNVHRNLMDLSRLGVVEFEWEGRARRPVVPYDELSVSVPLRPDGE